MKHFNGRSHGGVWADCLRAHADVGVTFARLAAVAADSETRQRCREQSQEAMRRAVAFKARVRLSDRDAQAIERRLAAAFTALDASDRD